MSTKGTRFSNILKNTEALTAVPVPSPVEDMPRKLGRPAGKKSNPAYRQVTVYLEKDIHIAAQKMLLDEGKQFSELVNELVREWIKTKV